ncbi:MORN repeat-containing protein [Pusillimonas minor]|uniref:MORN repeat-containing protein n=1 Tax=Pusillimonas minor TaxID=2697024 RepID=A0A842HPP9_9BURK|nr:hypothetical protein [Pusillimonas minor]MBC2769834.1 hypothetical protein [Pusillimonas minor]
MTNTWGRLAGVVLGMAAAHAACAQPNAPVPAQAVAPVAAQTPAPAQAAAPAATQAPAPTAPACRVFDPELQGDYAGGCENGLAQGQGQAKGAAGALYQGQFVAGKKHGYGVKLYPNGDGYAGHWENDMRHGHGRYEYGKASPWRGDVYQGGWQNDRQHGKGTYIFSPSGDRYTATFDQGVPKDVGTPTTTRRKRVLEVLLPVLGKPGTLVCSVTTEGAAPTRIARGVVLNTIDDRLLVNIQTPQTLSNSADPALNPRWEVLTNWMLCPTPAP